jgi:hypothetical protein
LKIVRVTLDAARQIKRGWSLIRWSLFTVPRRVPEGDRSIFRECLVNAPEQFLTLPDCCLGSFYLPDQPLVIPAQPNQFCTVGGSW